MASPWGSGSPDPGNHPTNPCTPGQWAYIYGADDEWTGGSAEMVMLEGDVENTELSPSAPWSTCWHWTGREFDDGYTQGYLAYAADWTTDVPNPDIMGIIYNIPGDDL
jgi:hypothetical protein